MSDAPHEPFGMPADPTHQAVYDKVVRHLFRQGRQSIDDEGYYYYRTVEDGDTLACAVGHLIPDDRYVPTIEGVRAYEQPVIEALGIGEEDHPLIPLLRDLQVVHDEQGNWEGDLTRLAGKLLVIAQNHALDTTEVGCAHAAYLARRV